MRYHFRPGRTDPLAESTGVDWTTLSMERAGLSLLVWRCCYKFRFQTLKDAGRDEGLNRLGRPPRVPFPPGPGPGIEIHERRP